MALRLIRLKDFTLSFHLIVNTEDFPLCEDFINLIRRLKPQLEKTNITGLVRVLLARTTIFGENEDAAIMIREPFPFTYFNIIISIDKLRQIELESNNVEEIYLKWALLFFHELAHFAGIEDENDATKQAVQWLLNSCGEKLWQKS